jgi:hypothetical protein
MKFNAALRQTAAGADTGKSIGWVASCGGYYGDLSISVDQIHPIYLFVDFAFIHLVDTVAIDPEKM